MKKAGRVCVLFGGSSDERKISIKSGKAVLAALRRQGVYAEGLDARNGFEKHLTEHRPSLAFIAMHGTGGEDGTIQRKLEKRKIPFVGSDAKSSLITFDKIKAKSVFKRAHIPTPACVILKKKNWQSKLGTIPLPAVIKPIRNGSSIDVFMVDSGQSLQSTLTKIFKKYDDVMVEKKIEGREFTVGILGKRTLPVIELCPKRSFYDFKAKYTKGLTDYLVPAPISPSLAKKLQTIALKTHETLGLRDFSRVDIMVDQEQNPYVLEANSIPGFTETSLLPKAARAVGISFDELCLELLRLARKRARKSS